ncbi:MAG TPA: tetratricopeptide repeat protein, partial [bacterium]|nr:tetratricopeptide repeat protein [bacterium]
MKKNFKLFILAVLFFAGAYQILNASQGSAPRDIKPPSAMDLYNDGVAYSNKGNFYKAQDLFTQALKLDPNNPDIMNMLAHSQRKQGLLDDAMMNYWFALKLRPNFPESREYLAEAYLQGLLKEMDELKNEGDKGKEQLAILT